MNTLYQILGIARTELRFALRRGGPVVGVLAVSLVTSGSALYLASNDAQDYPSLSRALLGGGMNELYMAWPAFLLLTLAVLPMVCATAIPSDRQFKTHELLCSFPLGGAAYLAGKVLGTWAAVTLVGGIALSIHLLLHLLLAGPPNAGLYLALTVLCGLPLSLWSSAAGVLVGSVLSTRRSAWLAGLLVGLASVFVAALAFRPAPDYHAIPVLHYSSQAQATANLLTHNVLSDAVFQHFHVYSMDADIRLGLIPPATGSQVALALAAGLAALLAGSLLARAWLARKESF